MSDDSQTPEGGTPLAGANPTYIADPLLDTTVRMVVELAAQVWVERERRLTLEAMLIERGVLSAAASENWTAPAVHQELLKRERAQFIEDVFKELRRIPGPAGH